MELQQPCRNAPADGLTNGTHVTSVRLAVAWSFACGPLVAGLLNLTTSAWAAMLFYHLGCLAAAVRISRLGGRPRWLGLGLLAFACIAVITAAGAWLIAWVPELRLQMAGWMAWGLQPDGDIGILTYYVIVNPWAEELFWRGAVLGPHLRAQLGMRASAAISILLFSLFHIFVLRSVFDAWVTLVATLFIVVAAIAWTVLRLRTGNVWWAAVSHQAANAGLAILYFIHLREVR